MAERDVLDGKRVLIVDDEPDILETLDDILDMCLIDSAPDFESAQKFLDKVHYDCAILDIMGVRGYDLLELCNEKGIPALMLTAHALTPDNLVKSIKKGAQSYVPKDKIADIAQHLSDIIKAHEQGTAKHGAWFTKLRPFFDKKFGPHWRDEHREFWDEFDRTYRVSKEELEEIL
jgi:DNA-binding NtrC family response regulator